jgi:hypothetical protein
MLFYILCRLAFAAMVALCIFGILFQIALLLPLDK